MKSTERQKFFIKSMLTVAIKQWFAAVMYAFLSMERVHLTRLCCSLHMIMSKKGH